MTTQQKQIAELENQLNKERNKVSKKTKENSSGDTF